VGARLAEPCLRLLKEIERASSRHTKKKPKQRHPQILTRSGARPIVPVGRPLEPRSPQALPRVAPLPTLAPFPPRTPEAPRERPAQASSRRPRDRPPIRPARAPALGGHAVRPDPQSHPNHLGQGVKYPLGLPPLLGPRPWCPGPRHRWCQPTWRLARRPLAQPRVRAEAKSGRHVIIFVIIIIVVVVVVRRLRRRLQREPIPRLPPTTLLQGFPSSHPLASSGLFRVLLLLVLLCGKPTRGSVRHVLQDRWPGEFKTPQPLGTNKNPNSKNQRRKKNSAQNRRRIGHLPGTHTHGRGASRAGKGRQHLASLPYPVPA
jgi:hypothetical protein